MTSSEVLDKISYYASSNPSPAYGNTTVQSELFLAIKNHTDAQVRQCEPDLSDEQHTQQLCVCLWHHFQWPKDDFMGPRILLSSSPASVHSTPSVPSTILTPFDDSDMMSIDSLEVLEDSEVLEDKDTTNKQSYGESWSASQLPTSLEFARQRREHLQAEFRASKRRNGVTRSYVPQLGWDASGLPDGAVYVKGTYTALLSSRGRGKHLFRAFKKNVEKILKLLFWQQRGDFLIWIEYQSLSSLHNLDHVEFRNYITAFLRHWCSKPPSNNINTKFMGWGRANPPPWHLEYLLPALRSSEPEPAPEQSQPASKPEPVHEQSRHVSPPVRFIRSFKHYQPGKGRVSRTMSPTYHRHRQESYDSNKEDSNKEVRQRMQSHSPISRPRRHSIRRESYDENGEARHRRQSHSPGSRRGRHPIKR